VQAVTEEIVLHRVRTLLELHPQRDLCLSGGVALNCVANAALAAHGPFERVWAQPAAGDAGTALGAALLLAAEAGDRVQPMTTAALGRGFDDREVRACLERARVPFEEPDDLAAEVAGVLADDGVVAWFQGRAEFGPRALGHRSLLANPARAENLARLNDVKGREHFRPIAPVVLEERADALFDGQLPSPYMLFTHRVRPEWRRRIPAVVHVDGTARIQTVDRSEEPLVAQLLDEFERRTGVPVLVNTSLNTRGRPMVDSPEDALECFGSSPVDLLAIGPFVMTRRGTSARRDAA
jgi:carbamoyltransferase